MPQVYLRTADAGAEGGRVVSDRVLSLRYVDKTRGADKLTLEIDNADLTQHDDPAWKRGARIEVQWGVQGRMSPLRSAIVRRVRGFRRLTVEARSDAVLMDTRRRSRTFQNKTRAEVAAEVAREYGFDGESLHVQSTTSRRETIVQANMTDAQFLRRLARREGYEFFVDFDGLHFREEDLRQAAAKVLTYYVDRVGEIIGDPQVDTDLTRRPGRVRARSTDPETGEEITAEADDEQDAERDVLSEILEVVDPEDGESTFIRRMLGTTSDAPSRTASEEEVPTQADTAQEAETEARARFRRGSRGVTKMTVPIYGDALVMSQQVVEMRGLGRRLSGRYIVREVEHVVGSNGYTCSLKIASDGGGGHNRTSQAAPDMSVSDEEAAQIRAQGLDALITVQQEALEGLSARTDVDPETGAETTRWTFTPRPALPTGGRQ